MIVDHSPFFRRGQRLRLPRLTLAIVRLSDGAVLARSPGAATAARTLDAMGREGKAIVPIETHVSVKCSDSATVAPTEVAA